MGRQVLGVSAALMTAVLLALGVGRAMPRGEQLLFSSSANWQAGAWNIYVLDMNRRVSQRLLTSHTDTVPGLPIVWSPDGRQIAFLSDETNLETYLVDPQGKNLRRLAGLPADNVYNAAWSPDGRSLAYIGESDGKRDVYLAVGDGSSPRNLTEGRGSFRSLVWSPDSRFLALESLPLVDVDIYTLNVETRALVNLTNSPGNDVRPSWSPDGSKIAFMSSRNSGDFGNTRYDLYLMNSDGSKVHRYTNTLVADTSWAASWSPDSQRVVFGSMSWGGGADVYLIHVPFSLTRNITRDSTRDGSPVWSPDGEQIAFESRRTGRWEIYLMSADGWTRTQLTDGAVDSRRPAWSPDGRQVVYISNPGRNWDLYMTDRYALFTQRITHSRAIDFYPLWRPS